MATKALTHTRRTRRNSRRNVVDRAWLVALILRTLASIAVVIATRLIDGTACGGR